MVVKKKLLTITLMIKMFSKKKQNMCIETCQKKKEK